MMESSAKDAASRGASSLRPLARDALAALEEYDASAPSPRSSAPPNADEDGTCPVVASLAARFLAR
jgi:nicotinic acid mononucleotide adenylyltransferase